MKLIANQQLYQVHSVLQAMAAVIMTVELIVSQRQTDINSNAIDVGAIDYTGDNKLC